MRRRARFIGLCGWYLIVILLVIAALIVSALRLLLPLAEDYRGDLEAWASATIGQPVAIESLNASWRGFEPLLVLEQVKLLSDDRSQTILQFDNAKIGVSLWRSISQGNFVPGTLIIAGANIHMARQQDGRISIGSISTNSEASDKTDKNRLGQWLLSQNLLELQDSELHWQDFKRNQPQWSFSEVNLRINNDGDRHQVTGSVGLPDRLGENLQIALDVEGNVLTGREWSGQAFLAASGIQLTRWIAQKKGFGAELASAIATGKVWARWQAAELVAIHGKARLTDIRLHSTTSASLVRIDQLSSRFALANQQGAWRLGLDDFYLQSKGIVWPSSSLFVEFDENHHAKMMLSHINLAVINQLQSITNLLPEHSRALLRDLAPSGSVRDLYANVSLAQEQPVYLIQGKLRDFSNHSREKIPGFRQLAGDFVLTPTSGSFQLQSRGLVLDYPRLFDEFFYLSSAKSFINWRKSAQGWQLNIDRTRIMNRDIDASMKAEISLPADKSSPLLDVAVKLNRPVDSGVAKRYLPTGIMKPKISNWVRNAITAGYITQGEFLLYGKARGFPYRDGSGKLELRLGLEQGELSYAKGWPSISAIKGEFVYNGYGLSFDAEAGESVNHTLHNVQVAIKDFREKPLQLLINGEAEGLSQDKLNFLYQSPLNAKFANKLQALRLQGRSQLTLDMVIPLRQLNQTEVKGVVSIERNRLDAEAWKLAVDQLSGDLRFDRRGIYASPLSGWLGGVIPMELIIDTRELGDHREIVFTQASKLDPEKLTYILRQFIDKSHWTTHYSGETDVLAQLQIPLAAEPPRPILLTVNSSLEGAAISLPEPLVKQADGARLFRLKMELTGAERELAIRYGQANALFQLGEATARIERGAVGFQADAVLPEEHGFRYSGKLDRFSWSEWSPLIFPEPDVPALLTGGGPGASHYFDVDIQQFELFGAEFEGVKLQASNSTQGWNFFVDGQALAGNVFIPIVSKSAPMIMDMERLFVPVAKEGEGRSMLDPREMPALKVSSKKFSYNDIEFGALTMKSSRRESGLHLDELNMQTADTRITARGDWTVQAEGQRSRFDIEVETKNLGNTLKAWGYAGGIADGDGQIKINAAWPGRPTQFAFEQLTGKLAMDVKNGSLLEVKPGAARLFGLLSLQALPRRLFLDFSDVFAKGMSFDVLKGEFDIDAGNAFTNALTLDGPSASITMAGRVGLVQQDYDQVVTVVPKVGASIPLLGALAVAPQIGATLFVVQKLLQKQIDDISALQYVVTGSWENPDIRQIAKPEVPEEDEFLE